MLVDEGLLAKLDGIWTATGDVDEVPMPPTINALLSARLDRLDTDEREVLQAASVVGREFWSGSIRALAPHVADGVAQHLHALVRKRLIMPGGSSPIAGEDAFRFTHILVRDAAYPNARQERRAQMHERHADWLLEKSGERAPELGEIVGYHLEQAYRAREEIGPTTRHAHAVAQRGASSSLRLDGALDRGDTRRRHAAPACVRPPRRRSVAGRAGARPGDCTLGAGQLTEAEALFERAIQAAENTGDDRHEPTPPSGLRTSASARTSRAPRTTFEPRRPRGSRRSGLGDRRGLANALRLRLTWAWDSQLAAMAEALRRALAEAEAAATGASASTHACSAPCCRTDPHRDGDPALRGGARRRCRARRRRGRQSRATSRGLLAMAGRFQEAREYSLQGHEAPRRARSERRRAMRAALADAEVLAGDPRPPSRS